ncbi:MAG: hypothetical protein CO129_03805 [Ignavibacteriales bacterium CG_4_9_14_3_um_filter_34_10]|nr:MAG: hypothetical protein CO129_03805 [Ignavibacteriales bacterium CG_4_9_14_3_um_filter_34_10]
MSLMKDPSFDKCPECGSIATLRRSRAQNFGESLIKSSGLFNYFRCRNCGWRGIRPNFSLKKISAKNVFIYLGLIIFVAILTRFVITRFIK